MKKWFLHILLLAGLFGVLTTSCSQEEGLEPQVPTEKIPVSFSIALNNSSARSRADETGKEIWGNNYDGNPDNNYSSEVGNEFENKANFYKIDIDESLDIARQFSVSTVPTVIIFKNGEPVERLVGFMPKEHLASKIKEHI